MQQSAPQQPTIRHILYWYIRTREEALGRMYFIVALLVA